MREYYIKMGKYKDIAIDQENGICCFPECDNLYQEYNEASPLIKNGKCCDACYYSRVMPKRTKYKKGNILIQHKKLKEELQKVIDYVKKLNEVIFDLQNNIYTITEERDQLLAERDVIEQTSKIIHLDEYSKILELIELLTETTNEDT